MSVIANVTSSVRPAETLNGRVQLSTLIVHRTRFAQMERRRHAISSSDQTSGRHAVTGVKDIGVPDELLRMMAAALG
jgi:hypothetical protein